MAGTKRVRLAPQHRERGGKLKKIARKARPKDIPVNVGVKAKNSEVDAAAADVAPRPTQLDLVDMMMEACFENVADDQAGCEQQDDD